MSVLQGLQDRAAARPAHIVLSEGHDPRVVAGAVSAVQAGIARITLVGTTDEVHRQLADTGATVGPMIAGEDPQTSPLTDEFAQTYFDLRKHKGVSEDIAAIQARDPLVFAAMMVRNGHADGTVGGAVATTSDTVRAALQIIGKAKDAPLVSSFFLMALPEGHPSGRSAMIFGDCGLVIDPNAEELAAIAVASAASCKQLLGDAPKVALLSFSTKGSARHPAVTKVSDAVEILQRDHPDLPADGELQFDAAFVPEVGASKAPGSTVAGHANVMIFPNLDAGNIGYKIAQRIGGADAIGPVLQGLSKPANDLSRGCTAQDVTNMIAVTTLQASS
ncbi:phosphate acetyltransferase [Sulfitobacter mediterraneus]|uniref:phosphate acetyltransferase n=1 Tax=Sulfitobacter mediterraneus TaxID=83219 RepID=UPI00193321A7|nr:phosphate acetyltransferase [Sulfitobacter mediterraneus]MBM1310166.1 phosphate acetyltransferase [Sulfitobacter mediterraneus]MBM1314050.1 phosphate acetyltransferase [Sulfitobacter mediterraneus]MBM1322410.1 phosphate acetyltransferase [Sulfitobacter mediterraneus]MBM1326322.1 phosphate acetyltransferase [Sulfitobacter mediterraneus]MBM1397668.1 phosphate acetyltransferase [Sulfitobacter mediterraneus]